MIDKKSLACPPKLPDDLTAQEAEESLLHLAQISVGAPTLQSATVDWLDTHTSNPITDGRGSMTHDLYRTLVEQLPVVSFMAQLGSELSEIYISPQIESLLGYSQQEWLENPILWYERLHPEDQMRWNREFSRFLVLDEPFRSVYRFLARDGHTVWVRGEVRIMRNAQGQPQYIQGIGYDVTELQEAEEALRHAHEQLAMRVEERTAQLAAANAALREEILVRERAEAALRQQTEVLQHRQSEIQSFNERLKRTMQETHHRVKNNMQLIAALAEMQNVEGTATVPAAALKGVSMQARILALLHDMLTRHLQEDAAELELSVTEVLEELVYLLQQIAGDHVIRLSAEDASLTLKQGTALAIIVHELIVNAIKYGHSNVEIRFTIHGARGALEVADNGAGFPENFDALADANYGLELVNHISRSDLDGHVTYDNRPEGGARIVVDMPLNTGSGNDGDYHAGTT